MTKRARAAIVALACLLPAAALEPGEKGAEACRKGPAVQVLGSGGPMHGGARGGAAYVLWHRGEPAVIVDMGGDTPVKLAEAGVKPGHARVMLVSHLHPDHVAGLPDYLWGEMTANRTAPLTVIGPQGGDAFLDIGAFFDRLFGAGGAFPDLRHMRAGRDFPLKVRSAEGKGEAVLAQGDLRIRALRVDHGRAPTLAYRIDGPGFALVLAGDQTMRDPGFTAFASGATVLIAHAILSDAARDTALARVVALPEDIGRAAAAADVDRLVLAHLMAAPAGVEDASLWSLADMKGVVAGVRGAFKGRLDVAGDLGCFSLQGH